MIGSTYKIFSNPAVDGLSGFKPSEEAIQNVKDILKDTHKNMVELYQKINLTIVLMKY